MQRSGARHPDAAESVASTSSMENPELKAQELYATLNEYLLLESKFQPRLCLPVDEQSGEVTTGARDGAAHVLRCLKVWYDLPPDVLINAISLFDRFLTKMKVRPCHVPCITVACMNIALEQWAADTGTGTERKVSVEELVSISQSACTAGDVVRMSRVIGDKLSVLGSRARTSLCWLRLFAALLRHHTRVTVPQPALEHLLEVVSCDAACATARTAHLALVLLYHKLEQVVAEWALSSSESETLAQYLKEFARQLQAQCHMTEAGLAGTCARVRHVLSRYESSAARCGARAARGALVWRLSERTRKLLRPTDRLTSLLPTILEQHPPAPHTRTRSGSESSENEETSDWPRSPVLPVYCDN